MALAPALWVLLLAGAAVLATRRWLDPIPWPVAGGFVAIVIAVLAPALLGGQCLLPLGMLRNFPPFHQLIPPPHASVPLQWDLITEITPWQLDVRRALATGRWPLWNALAGAGMPLLGDPQSQVFQPFVALAYVLPVTLAPGASAALRLLVALFGMYLLLARQGIERGAACFGALAFAFSGALLLWLGWPIANSVALLPLGAYAALRCVHSAGRRDVVLVALVTCAIVLGGHPETQLYALAAVSWMAFAATWRLRRAGAEWRRPLLRCAVALLLGALVAAPVWLPQQAWLPQTDRAQAMQILSARSPSATTGASCASRRRSPPGGRASSRSCSP